MPGMDSTSAAYQTISSVWHDPVWSKVISAVIIALAGLFFGWFKKGKRVALPMWVIVASVVVLALIASWSILWLTILAVICVAVVLWFVGKGEGIEVLGAAPTVTAEILSPRPHAEVRPSNGKVTVQCRFTNAPDLNNLRAFVERDGHWMPQPTQFRQSSTADQLEYTFDVWINRFAKYQIHVVQISELGAQLVKYYDKVVQQGRRNREIAGTWGIDVERAKAIPMHLGVEMPALPLGLASIGHVTINAVQ